MIEQKLCPICQKPVQEKSKPFCSKRCAEIDLHRWFGGAYAVPTQEKPETVENIEEKD